MPRDTNRLLELLPRYDQAGPRYTSYPTAPAWSSDLDAANARRHWERYLGLDPHSAWAETARDHLALLGNV